MGELNLTQMTGTQTAKSTTSNLADDELDLALTNEIATHDGSASIVVSATEFTRNFFHIIGGTSAGAFDFTVPSTTRPFMVINNTDDIATVKQSSGITVDIEAGDMKVMYSGAAGIYDMGGATVTGDVTVNEIGNIGGGTQDIDIALGVAVTAEVSTSATTFTFSNPQATLIETAFTLLLTNGGSQTVNWPASVQWAGGSAPTLTASGVDYLQFYTVDGGTVYYGLSLGLAFPPPVIPSGVGGLWVWGFNNVGQLGTLNTTSYSSPVQVGALEDWSGVFGGSSVAHFVKEDGTLWGTGEAGNGRLGDGTTVDKSSPVQIGALTDWSTVGGTVVTGHSIKTDGTLWAWGRAAAGGLGNGTITPDLSSPVQIGALTDWGQVDSMNNGAAAVKTDNTLWVWGEGAFGRLGNSSTTDLSSPVQIGALTDWAQVSCATSFTFAIKTDGTLWSWGDGADGRTAQGNTTDISSPVQVGALTDWLFVECENNGGMAIKTDGTLWGWGRNQFGQLGQENTTAVSSPVQVGALTDWDKLTYATEHMMAIKTDGTLWACGRGNSGRLGFGNSDVSSPIQIGALTDWASVSAYSSSTYGIRQV